MDDNFSNEQQNPDLHECDTVLDIGIIFIEGLWNIDPKDLCPKCRRELGMFTLEGFDV